MKKLCYIVALVLGFLLVVPSYAQDYARLGERTIMGTARYVGMSGAMSAIGGDPSAVHDNPAGLGLYRRTEVLVTFEEDIDKTWQVGVDNTTNKRFLPMCPQASLVWSAPRYKDDEQGVLFNNFMFTYRRLQSYGRTMYGTAANSTSLGSILPTLDIPFCADATSAVQTLLLKERGYVNEYAFNWAMNISNQWYVGAGFQIQSYLLSADATYEEQFNTWNTEGNRYFNKNTTTVLYSGTSCSLSAGLIYRPVRWLRFGLGLQTYSLGSLYTGTTGTLTAQTDSLRNSYAPDQGFREASVSTMPLHFSFSTAFQIGAYGLISLQYDLFHQYKAAPMHSLRAGIEVIPVLGLYINAGYACESEFRRADRVVPMDATFDRQDTYYQFPKMAHYASVAVGYRGTYMIVQAAYQYRLQRLNLYAHEAANPYDMHADTHRIVLTIGWHRH